MHFDNALPREISVQETPGNDREHTDKSEPNVYNRGRNTPQVPQPGFISRKPFNCGDAIKGSRDIIS